MKNAPFYMRFRFALKGIQFALETEASFRTQAAFAVGASLSLVLLRPKPVWWALIAMTISAVFAAELLNTALEAVVDRLHPDQHIMIARAKDCAAGAVLILSFASLAVEAALLWDCFSRP